MPLFKNAAFFLACLILGPFAAVDAASCTADACVRRASGNTCPSWMDDTYASNSDEEINGVTLCVGDKGGSVDMGGSFGGGADAVEGAVITLDGATFTGPFDTCAETAPETIPEGSEPTSEATKTAAVMAVAAVVVGSSLIL